MLNAHEAHVAERAALGIPPLPLSPRQAGELIELLKNPPKGEEKRLLELITRRVPAGVDDAAKVNASYLVAVAHGKRKVRVDLARKSDRTAGHDAWRLQHHAAGRSA